MVSESGDNFFPILNLETKNPGTYTIFLPRSSQQFSERHYIGLRLVVSDMSMRIHDLLRQPCPSKVSFGKGEKRILRNT